MSAIESDHFNSEEVAELRGLMGRATPLTAHEYEQVDSTTRVHSTPSTPAHTLAARLIICNTRTQKKKGRRVFQTHIFPQFTYLLLCIKTGRIRGVENGTIVSYIAALAKCHMACITIASDTSERVSVY